MAEQVGSADAGVEVVGIAGQRTVVLGQQQFVQLTLDSFDEGVGAGELRQPLEHKAEVLGPGDVRPGTAGPGEIAPRFRWLGDADGGFGSAGQRKPAHAAKGEDVGVRPDPDESLGSADQFRGRITEAAGNAAAEAGVAHGGGTAGGRVQRARFGEAGVQQLDSQRGEGRGARGEEEACLFFSRPSPLAPRPF